MDVSREQEPASNQAKRLPGVVRCAPARGSSQARHPPSVLSELLGRAELPGGVRVHEIASDFVPGVERDEFDVPYVVRFPYMILN